MVVEKFNSVEDIKKLLMLETENQTLSDEEIEGFIEDAYEQLVSEVGTHQIETFRAERTGLNYFIPFFNIHSIERIYNQTLGEDIDSDNYDIKDGGDTIQISDLKRGDDIVIYYIPENYIIAEKAIAIENILSRISPFTGQEINPAYATWRERRKNYMELIKSNIGGGTY